MLNPSQLFSSPPPSGSPFHLSGKRVPLGAQLLLLWCPFQDLYLISQLLYLALSLSLSALSLSLSALSLSLLTRSPQCFDQFGLICSAFSHLYRLTLAALTNRREPVALVC